MFAIKPTGSTIALVLASLCTLSACGGNEPSQSLPLPVATDPTPPTSPTPPTTPPTTPPPPTTPGPVRITLASTATPISAAVSYSTDWWVDWTYTGSDAIQDVACTSTNVQHHAHALISFYKDGQRLALPGNVGRNSNCNYELQTLDKSGLVHIESSTAQVFTLGQFFAVWGQSLSASTVAGLAGTPTFYIIDNGTITQFTGDPQTITLDAHREILIVTGTPPTQVPRYDWNNSGL
jgi:hypothetical protein